MDEILFYGGIVIIVLFSPWIFLWRSHRKRVRQHEEDQTRWGQLTERIFSLEQTVQRLKDGVAAPPKVESAAIPLATRSPKPPVAPEPSQPSVVTKEPVSPAPPPPVPPIAIPPEPRPVPPPTLKSEEPKFSFTERYKSALNVEEALGTNWLNKLGVGLLVSGVAFFLAFQLKTLGPAGKVLVGYVTSVALLGAGIWFERNHRYQILARAGVGGGWALLFFTTYAMYHVAAAHVLSSQALDLVLMLIVAGAMVWHTLRYRSQVVTGLAFILAFLTVTISHSNVYSLSAGAVLALALVIIVGRMQWFVLELFGILASYLNHYLWLRPIIEPMQRHRHPFPEFAASAGLLSLYWIIFRVSYLLRKPQTARQEHISSVAAVLNTVLLLVLFKYQSTHPEWAFWALLTIGAIETLLAQLPITRRRRSAVIVLSTLGVILLLAAFPFRYSGNNLSVLWLLEAEALLLIGVWNREVIFRRLGLLASALAAGQMISVNAARVLGMRIDGGDVRSDFPLAMIFGIAAVVFYADAHWIARRWNAMFFHDVDKRLTRYLSYIAALMAIVGLWIAFPEAWTAVAWCAFGLALAFAGRRFAISEFGYQAYAAGAAAVVRVFAINLETTSTTHHVSIRLLSMGAVALLLYATAWLSRGESDDLQVVPYFSDWRLVVRDAYSWMASFLLGLLAWYELRPVGVAVAWAVGGLFLLELGLTSKSRALRLQAYVAFLASFARIFFLNLNASGFPGEVSPRVYTVVPLVFAYFYAYWRLGETESEVTRLERKLRAAEICSYLGTIAIAALMRFELEADWVAAAWAALAVVLLAIAWRSGHRVFLHQSLWLAFGVGFRASLHNFYQRSYFPAPFWDSRLVCVGVAIALLFAGLPLSMRLRVKGDIEAGGVVNRLLHALDRRPEQFFFFIAVGLLTVLLALEMRHGMVTLSWGIEGLAVFLLALWLAERSFRLTGLGLLLLCVGKILIVDVWGLNLRDKFLTLIVLGAALLLVSFLYTKNREALRQYL